MIKIEIKIRVLILIIAMAALSLLVYRDVLYQIALSVFHREGSSHGVLVPFMSAFFIWTRWKRLKTARLGFAPVLGTATVGLGLFILFLNKNTGDIALPALSFFVITAGIVLGLFGKEVFRHVGFPVIFLVTMVPVPEEIYSSIADWMKVTNTAGSVWLVKTIGVPVYREAFNVCFPETTLHVAPSCSGIRYLLSYFVFGLAYAYLFKESTLSRILVVLAAIPISIIGGILRLSTIFLAAHYISPVMAQHNPHVLLSWGVFGVVLIAAIGLDRLVSGYKA